MEEVSYSFIFYYEKGFRANKFGIPGGVFSSTPLPEKVEDYYSKSNSRTLSLEAFDASSECFEASLHKVRPFKCQLKTSENLLSFLKGSNIQERKKEYRRKKPSRSKHHYPELIH